jgi:uncharacterized protein
MHAQMRDWILGAIRFYQQYISPYKGFCCAYRFHTGHASCSTLGYRAVRRFGLIDGLGLLRRRLYLCGVAHRRFSPSKRRPHKSQRGDCDLGCDLPCDGDWDMPSMKSCRPLDVLDYADVCDCDWPTRDDKRKKKRDDYVYVPPRAAR